MFQRFSPLLLLLFTAAVMLGDEPATKKEAKSGSEKSGHVDPSDDPAQTATIQLSDDLRDALVPLFRSIEKSEVSRATVEMLTDSVLSGQVVESQESTFQIASKTPNQFTVYLKEPKQRTRVYCDGDTMSAAMAPDAFFRFPQVVSIQDAVTSLAVPMGPYPEPLLALTMAGADPKITFLAGMKSIRLVDRKPFRSTVPAVHLRGVQADAVTWDLWITDDKKNPRRQSPRPLRLLIDLTPMLAASDQVHVPAGFSYQVRYDFLRWRVTGEIEESLFRFEPAKDATEYKSLEHYYEAISGADGRHPLLGKRAPLFKANTIDGKQLSTKESAGKVLVVDFWASWCTPCLAAMPVIQEVTDRFEKKGVVFVPVNTGEKMDDVIAFLKEKKLDLNSALDPVGKIADAFHADSIPLTVVIGKGGAVESVHTGFAGEDALRQRLTEELEILSIGGKIGSSSQDPPQP